MTIGYYDGSWIGLLTLIFEAYEYKLTLEKVLKGEALYQHHLFGTVHRAYTDEEKAERVRKGLVKCVGSEGLGELYRAFLSEQEGVELLILRLVQLYLRSSSRVRHNYAHEDVLRLKQINKSVSRERHRFKAFVRFRLLQGDLYYAHIEPDFNILPLIAKHFKDRYADQRWLIYDLRRNYGIFYEIGAEVIEVQLDHAAQFVHDQSICAEGEELYDDLWKRYFKSTNITERKNTKLHVQHVPKRYWKYLNEKDLF